MMKRLRLMGLVPATHTPFKADGSLKLRTVKDQAEHLLRHNLTVAFVAGSTGESQSLAFDERRQLAERWIEVARGTPLKVVVHVGSNSLPEAKALARHAEGLRAAAIAALAPYFFKPANLEGLVEWCAQIARAAPRTPFYYYDIPVRTHVVFPMPEFLALAGERIPTLNGIKFTNSDLLSYQLCLQADGGAYDIPWGTDETLLAALAFGGTGAVGSSYNFAAPTFQRVVTAVARGDLATARAEQQRATALVHLLLRYGYLGASKVVMKWLGVDVGPCRQPLANLDAAQAARLRRDLEALGFFDQGQ